ncbi:MAG TPA: asparagine synthase-related protein [Herpetosiphonaceae bacterium]
MSAIAAVVHWDQRPVDALLLDAMNRCMCRRCPDGAWSWADGAFGLAQADLATLPEDEPGVPVVAGELRIAASCRIDNRAELRRMLPQRYLLDSNTDAALILSAYLAWGEACVERLIGDFAFVIWDGAHRSLFAARDLSGSRQLFYYADRARLLLASDRMQILQDTTVPLDVDEEQVLAYLTPAYHWYNGWDQGLFRGFHALPAGSLLRARDGQVEVRAFWQWHEREPDRRSEREMLEHYLHTLDEAVRCRLRSRQPQVAIELSGGLDSPAVASLAARIDPDQRPDLHAFSLVFDTVPEVDERARILPVLERYPLRSHMLPADDLYAPQFMDHQWTPYGILGPQELCMPRAVPRLYDDVAGAGCRVLLTGDLGDALNGGSGLVYFDLLRRRRWPELARRFGLDLQHSWRDALLRLCVYGVAPLAPMPIFEAGLGLWQCRRQGVDELPRYLPAQIQRRIREVDRAIRQVRQTRFQVRCPVARSTLVDITPPMVPMTMAFPQPLERRHPYGDRRLIELVLAMPAALKWEPTERAFLRASRWHHRRALAGILPDAVRVDNVGVDFSPVIDRCLAPTAIRDWFARSPVVHIFERGYAQPAPFWEEIERSAGASSYLIALLGLEGWFRAIDTGGAMRQLIPPRSSHIPSVKCQVSGSNLQVASS